MMFWSSMVYQIARAAGDGIPLLGISERYTSSGDGIPIIPGNNGVPNWGPRFGIPFRDLQMVYLSSWPAKKVYLLSMAQEELL